MEDNRIMYFQRNRKSSFRRKLEMGKRMVYSRIQTFIRKKIKVWLNWMRT